MASFDPVPAASFACSVAPYYSAQMHARVRLLDAHESNYFLSHQVANTSRPTQAISARGTNGFGDNR